MQWTTAKDARRAKQCPDRGLCVRWHGTGLKRACFPHSIIYVVSFGRSAKAEWAFLCVSANRGYCVLTGCIQKIGERK